MTRTGLLLASAALLTLTGVAAHAQEKVFRYATTGDILGLDPHSHNEGPTNTMKNNFYGRLIHRAPDLSLEPDLATSWERIDDTTWRFDLRPDVTFHNGNPFTASDVVYSFNRQSQDSSEMSFALSSVADVTAVDDLTVEVKTSAPDPTLLLNMPNFYIVDEEFMEANDAFEVIAGAGQTNFANLNVNGTGPYRLVEWVQDNQVVLEPNEDWWGHETRTDNI
ncbi:MAG: ABC transporter substrate-binding protein, partial [Pseudomonadota bacterium]